ncbi:MAG: hypothetical protein AAF657_20885 [Acidobacteriota bacterium]
MRISWLSVLLLVVTVPLEATTAGDVGGCAGTVPERILDADPASYRALLDTLVPGDLLRLGPGTYADGLPINGLHGEPDRCIVIEGPASGAPAIFTGRDCCNTVSLSNASYLVIRQLELDGDGRLGDGVKAESTSDQVHHLTLEDLLIRGHGANQQIVGVNTKCPVWNWVIRRNVIEGAGTGIYLGNSDGEDSFVAGLIEHNLIVDTVGYNLQIKHQNQRETTLGQPASGTTIIRHNVFSKANGGAVGGNARPNLLVGHWPLSNPGTDDDYLIYGNVFYQNPTEALFQGEGNVIFYGNLLLNDFGPALHIQPHNDDPRRIRLFQNTVVASTTGLQVVGGLASFTQEVTGNAVFAAMPLTGGEQTDNVADSYGAAASYLVNPGGQLTGPTDRLDLFPLPGTLGGTPIDLSGLSIYEDWNRDFNSVSRPGTFRGAYAGEGANPGWTLALERKPAIDPAIFADGFESGGTTAWGM